MGLTQRNRFVPRLARGGSEGLVLQVILIQRHRVGGDVFITNSCTIGRTAMVTHDAQHVFAVLGKAGERSKFLGHFS